MSWLVVGVLLLLAFVFSGIEAGLLSLNRVRLRHLIKRGDRKALLLEALLRDGERMMITVLVVTNWATLAALFLSTRELVAWFGGWGYGVSLVLGVVTRLLVVEVFPRVLFRGMGYRAVAVWTVPLLWVDGVLGPMHRFGKWLSRRFFRKRLPTGHRLFVGREDFKYLASSGERGGEISPEAADWIRRVIDFRSVPVGRLMRGFGGAVMVGEDVSVDALRGTGLREQWGRVLRRRADGVVTGCLRDWVSVRGFEEVYAKGFRVFARCDFWVGGDGVRLQEGVIAGGTSGGCWGFSACGRGCSGGGGEICGLGDGSGHEGFGGGVVLSPV